jgi:hypothetical protein
MTLCGNCGHVLGDDELQCPLCVTRRISAQPRPDVERADTLMKRFAWTYLGLGLAFWVLLFAATVWFCSGCGATLPSGCNTTQAQLAKPPIAESVIRAEWVSRYGPLPARCTEPVLWSVPSSVDAYHQVCPQHTAGCLGLYYGCTAAYAEQASANDAGLYAHEFAHYALQCQRGDADVKHTDPAVWSDFVGYIRGLPL